MAHYKPSCADCGKPVKSEYDSIYCKKCQAKIIKRNIAQMDTLTSHDIRLITGGDEGAGLKYE